MTYIWEDTPKRGENYLGWFASVIRSNGHIYKTEGEFKTKKKAETWASANEQFAD